MRANRANREKSSQIKADSIHGIDDRSGYRFREYRLSDDWVVLVGKTDDENDYLTLKVAKPADWWFHVSDLPGSHVILRAKQGEEPGRDILRHAAAIAAYHSKARKAGTVPVVCTQACFIRKPRGSKPGTVQIRNEKIIKVRPGLPD